MINRYVDKLVSYGLKTGLISKNDEIYVTNRLLERLHLKDHEFTGEQCENTSELPQILNFINDYAVQNGLIETDSITFRDIFDTEIMDILTPYPSVVAKNFEEEYKISPKRATDYFYNLAINSNYIRKDRIAKDVKWTVDSEYGKIEITVNCSKPEKDSRAIALAKNQNSGYPKCQICVENVGYEGRANHPARANLRTIPVRLGGEDWSFQYSPYVYYNEHCILLNNVHTPMVINRQTFIKLFDFVEKFSHYVIGSNAGLPVVGGSILSHEHYQGGNHIFPMHRAKVEKTYTIKGYNGVKVSRLKWPLSVIRLSGKNKNKIIDLADRIFTSWQNYSDEDSFIFAFTDGEPHNTVTPILHKEKNVYVLDLVLRNNITTEEYPLGVFHPHQDKHHVKKENIGLIEVMGLAVLPARLIPELQAVKNAILSGEDLYASELTKVHADWATQLKNDYSDLNKDNVDAIIKEEIGKVFVQALEDAGVYKRDEKGLIAFDKFMEQI